MTLAELIKEARRKAVDGCHTYDIETGVGMMFSEIEELLEAAEIASKDMEYKLEDLEYKSTEI